MSKRRAKLPIPRVPLPSRPAHSLNCTGEPNVILVPTPNYLPFILEHPPGRPSGNARFKHATSVANARQKYAFRASEAHTRLKELLQCSGDHPVCHRCTSRGLICQYSSREPRARGPSKARLRNAVSSSDLRTSSYNPPTHTQAKSERPSHQLQHFRSSHGYESNGIQRSNYQGLRRVASIPRTHLNSQHTKKGLMSIPLPPPFQSWRDTCAAPASPFSFEDGNFPSSHFHMPSSVQYAACGGSASPWHDVRRVHSHSTLIGSTGTNIKKSINYGMHSPLPLMNGGDYLGAGSYGHVSAPGRHSPDFLGSLQPFDAMPQHTLSSSYDPQPQPLRTPDIYPWL